MTDVEKEILKVKLEGEKAILSNAITSLQRSKPADDRQKGDDEIAERDNAEYLRTQIIQQKSGMAQRIEAVLKRIDDPHFGNCFDCGEEIDQSRMTATKGSAIRCCGCESKREPRGGKFLYGSSGQRFSYHTP